MAIPNRSSLRRAAGETAPTPDGTISRFDRIQLGDAWPNAFTNGAVAAELSVVPRVSAGSTINPAVDGQFEIQPRRA